MILVTGATGNIGTELVPLLLAKGQGVRVVTRDAARIAQLDPRIDKVIGDLTDRETVRRAVTGVERVFMVSLIRDPSGAADRMLIEEAKSAGAKHIVKISAMRGGDGQVGPMHRDRETAVRESGLAWTFVRPGVFMANTLGWAPTIKAQGQVFSATGNGKVAPISPYDIAAVAAEALTALGHDGKSYEITGPELLSAPDQVAILSRVLGRPIACIDITIEAAADRMKKMGAPASLVDGLSEFWRTIKAGTAAVQTQDVERVLGRPAQNYEAWCEAHKAAFA
jgi:(4-alkanoyl-5-oxo-2,5-dihydrofuran-3-yl)methyl phosphate reductase